MNTKEILKEVIRMQGDCTSIKKLTCNGCELYKEKIGASRFCWENGLHGRVEKAKELLEEIKKLEYLEKLQ